MSRTTQSGNAARAGRASWFELHEEGWRQQNRARPLGALVREALQNAFDHGAGRVDVTLTAKTVAIEDDAEAGLARDDYAFKVFLGEKDTPPTWRGRKGRGLKELIASGDDARVETVGRTIHFDAEGRRVEPNARARGTRIELSRRTGEREREEALALLRLTLPPEGTRLRIGGREVRRPRLFASVPDCPLDTVEIRKGMEHILERYVQVDLYHPRPGETPHLFEMGLPVEPIRLPWHADVQQRIPLAAERDAARDPYKVELAAIILEALAPELDRKTLEGAWVMEVLGQFQLTHESLEAWAAKVLPRRAVLSGGSRIDDEARQLGATVVELRGVARPALEQIATVVEGAESYVERMRGPPKERRVNPGASGERFTDFARWLSRELTGHDLSVRFYEREPRRGTTQEDADFDAGRRELRINVKGRARLDDPLDPTTLGILLHELAHDATDEHDFVFLRRFEALTGKALRRFVERADELRAFRREAGSRRRQT
ncbi:MAG TPA: hypothetical protein VK420_11245 [Longimicrobium sp.]|nr:hypothetical protein [Longimicrobium sp.]